LQYCLRNLLEIDLVGIVGLGSEGILILVETLALLFGVVTRQTDAGLQIAFGLFGGLLMD
jgi:hypothetical protein